MQNIQRVTDHLHSKLTDPRQALNVIPTRTGHPCWRDDTGHYWRTYDFIERAQSIDTVQTTHQAYEAARAFGQFQKLLADLPAPRLHETLPDFHHTPKRFANFERILKADPHQRAGTARPEIQFALEHRQITGRLLDAGLPERITHNDTKLNNVLFDETTGQGLCVMDLDTVMPGLAGYDFGDMVRTTTSPADEDEPDLTKVEMQMPMFEALVQGYLAGTGDCLTPAEKQLLAFSGKLITFEIGLRFLTDHLAGDTYFKTHRPGHNLDRCRTQFELVRSIERQEMEMERVVTRTGRIAK
jgi:aminoglycoside phosphotransferase (APT) family kinase protein